MKRFCAVVVLAIASFVFAGCSSESHKSDGMSDGKMMEDSKMGEAKMEGGKMEEGKMESHQ